MRNITGYHVLDVIYIINFLCHSATAPSPPSPPQEVRIESTGREFLVRWKPPSETYGGVLTYLVNYNVLPSLRVFTNVVDGNDSFSLIPFGDHLGQLFLISLQASNDFGLGKQTGPRYIRAGCGENTFIDPGEKNILVSPFYPDGFHEGVVCVWTFATKATHGFNIFIEDIDLGEENYNCETNYLLIGVDNTSKKVCSNTSDTRLESSDVKLLFKSGIGKTGRGFKAVVTSVVKTPSAPANITLSQLSKAILVTWSLPEGNHVNISSYRLCHQILPVSSRICVIILANPKNRFILRTRGHEGQVFAISMTSRIEDVESTFSTNKILRAFCSKMIVVPKSHKISITHPSYPGLYKSGVMCHWSVRTEDYSPLTLHRKWIDIQNTTACSGDFLKFVSLKTERMCGTSHELSTTVFKKGSVELTFVSDERIEGHGFSLEAYNPKATDIKPSKTTLQQSTQSNNFKSSVSTSNSFTALMIQLNASSLKMASGTVSLLHSDISLKPFSRRSTSSTSTSLEGVSRDGLLVSTDTIPSKRSTILYTSLSPTTAIPTLIPTPTTSTSTLISTTSSTTTHYSIYKVSVSPSTTSSINEQMSIQRASTDYETTAIDREGIIISTTTSHDITENHSTFTEISTPFLDRIPTHPIYIMLIYRFNASNGQEYNTTQLIPALRNELVPYFSRSVFKSLEVTKWRLLHELIPIEIEVKFQVSKLLTKFKENSSFSLIHFISQTAIEHLLTDNRTWVQQLQLDKQALQKFRSSSNFRNQEIHNPCELLRKSCLGCRAGVTATYDVHCDMLGDQNSTLMESSTKPPTFPNVNQDDYNIIIIGAVCCTVLLTIIIIVVVFYCRKRSRRNIGIESNDIISVHDFVTNKFSGNVTMTGFSARKRIKKIKRRGRSLPCRMILASQKEEREIDEIVQRLGHFIADTKTLKRRLKIKKRHRRGDSV